MRPPPKAQSQSTNPLSEQLLYRELPLGEETGLGHSTHHFVRQVLVTRILEDRLLVDPTSTPPPAPSPPRPSCRPYRWLSFRLHVCLDAYLTQSARALSSTSSSLPQLIAQFRWAHVGGRDIRLRWLSMRWRGLRRQIARCGARSHR